MRRAALKTVVVAMAAGLLAGAAVISVRTLPASTRYPQLRRMAQFFFPPDDLFTPLIEEPLDLAVGAPVEFKFEHRYPGLHALDLDIPGPAQTGVMQPGLNEIVLDVSCRDSSGHRIGGQKQGGTPYWRDGGSGVSILTYQVPDELAYSGSVWCRVVPLSGWVTLPRGSTSPRVVVKKHGEE